MLVHLERGLGHVSIREIENRDRQDVILMIRDEFNISGANVVENDLIRFSVQGVITARV